MMMNKKRKIVFLSSFFFCALSTLSAQNSASAKKSQNAISVYNKALELEADEHWYEASQYYMEVVSVNPAFSEAWYHLADCSYKLGEYDLAFSYLENAEKYEKNNSKFQNLKGMICISLGRFEDAKNIFNDVLKKFPNDVDSHFGLAELELYEGKYSGAENQYLMALKRQGSNRKALLSLALLSAQIGRYELAENYLRRAMSYYSGESEVHYLASIIYMMKGDYADAEKHARIAVEIKQDYQKAYEQLSTVLYLQGKNESVIDMCDFLISQDRTNSLAWYLKGVAQEKLSLHDDAIETWSTGLNIQPQDEFMRMMMELSAKDYVSLDDSRRKDWAEYHIQNAKQYDSRYDKSGSLYEYQKALILNPSGTEARLSYADILELNGMHESYLSQLRFVQENSEETLPVKITDTIEAYADLLSDTLAKKWNVEPFYLDKTRWNIAVFYMENESSFRHADLQRLMALSVSDVFTGVAITSVKTQVTPVQSFAQAFQNARMNNFDYFVIVSASEGEDDISLSSVMYNGRSGVEAASQSFYATGNNRLSVVLRRFRNFVLENLTVKGKILARNGKTVLIDLGRSENVSNDFEFKIIRKGKLVPADSGTGLFYKDDDVVGTVKVTRAGEEVSEAQIIKSGFYDRINIDDEIVLVSIPKTETDGMDNVPNADENGNAVVENDVAGEEFVSEIKKAVERPAILEILRSIF